jgi:hypothetical protein
MVGVLLWFASCHLDLNLVPLTTTPTPTLRLATQGP